MKPLIVLLILCLVTWGGYRHFNAPTSPAASAVATTAARSQLASTPGLPTAPEGYACDGRTHCSQMRSCAEATFFIRHCPNTKMDGNGDGVPCEKQWCK